STGRTTEPAAAEAAGVVGLDAEVLAGEVLGPAAIGSCSIGSTEPTSSYPLQGVAFGPHPACAITRYVPQIGITAFTIGSPCSSRTDNAAAPWSRIVPGPVWSTFSTDVFASVSQLVGQLNCSGSPSHERTAVK